MRALITGAGGQDGPYLAEYLDTLGYDVWGTVHPLESPGVISLRAPQMTLIESDVSDPISLQRVLTISEPDEIYALAAISSVSSAAQHPVLAFQSTTIGIVMLLDWMRRFPGKRLFYASSCAIFGQAPAPQSEETPHMPTTFYGVAKLAAHGLVKIYREAYGIYCVNGILFNHESIWRPDKFVTRKVTRAVVSRSPLELGDLSAVRDWGYAGDYAKAMHLLLQQETPTDAVIGTGEGHTVEDLVLESYRLVGRERKVTTLSALKRPTDQLTADNSLIRSLGWKPEVTFSGVLERMIKADTRRLQGATEEEIAAQEQEQLFT